MNTTRPLRGRASERGEGYIRLVLFLAVLAIAAYIAFQNVPTYFAMQNLKHELAELVRGNGTINMPIERVQPQVNKLAQNYGIAPSDIKLEKQGKVLRATLTTDKEIDLIVTTYDWKISETYTQSSY
jgi:hypothetical protein